MIPLKGCNVLIVFSTLIWLNEAAKGSNLCPLGFKLTTTMDKNICYRLKGPELFTEKFRDCSGNLYTSELYHELNFPKSNSIVLWAEYKSSYPGGPFIDWSFTQKTGTRLDDSYEVKYGTSVSIDDELCMVIDPVSNFTATRCNERHYRYCFVPPNAEVDDMTNEGCEELDGYFRFWSPRSTCLTRVSGVGGGTVRATWEQAQELCSKRGGALLHRGWRYANNWMLLQTDRIWINPLGIFMIRGDTLLWTTEENGSHAVPEYEWSFQNETFSEDTSWVALHGDTWHLVNSSYIFYDVICEKSTPLRRIAMEVALDIENRPILLVNDTVNSDNIKCFSDSTAYYPTKIKFDRKSNNTFKLTTEMDGYYWCVIIGSKNYQVAESNKALYIKNKSSLTNVYAVKIGLRRKYSAENLQKISQVWMKKLKEYIYYRTLYERREGEIRVTDPHKVQELLKEFRRSSGLRWKDEEIIKSMKVKRLFYNRSRALVHIHLSSNMEPVVHGVWDDLVVDYMKPVYYCKAFDSVPTLSLGQSMTIGCKNYSCVGDFNEGVQWVTTAAEGECVQRPPVVVQSNVNVTDAIIIIVANNTLPEATKVESIKHGRLQIDKNISSSSEETEESNLTLQQLETTTPCDENGTTETTEFTETDATTITTFGTETTETESDEDFVVVVTFPSEVETIRTVTPWWIQPPTTILQPIPTSTEPPTTSDVTVRPRPPSDQLLQVMHDLDQLLQNDSVPIVAENINQAFNEVDVLLETETDLEIPSQFLHLLDKLGTKADLNGSQVESFVRQNIAMVMADAGPDLPVRGLRIASMNEDVFSKDAFEVITEYVNSSLLTVNESEAVVHFPESVASSPRRISFVIFRNDRAFQSNHSHYVLNSRVLSVNVENLTKFNNSEVIDIHFRPTIGDTDRNTSRVCAYWHFVDNVTGYWSQEGCSFIRAGEQGVLDICRCNHLTHFAEILVPSSLFSERNENILEIISIVGCCLSIFGLAMVALTAILFRSWRREFTNKIWLQLCIAIFILAICFLVIVFVKFVEYDVPCMLTGVLLHYSVLVSFCWMLVAAMLSYRRLVLVFTREVSHKLLRASAFSWGVPCAIVGILLSVAPHSYAGRFEEKTPSGAFCYPSGLSLWLTVYAPVALILVVNWTLFALIVRSVFAPKRVQRHGDSNEAFRCATVSCLLVFLFGLPWIFGLFAQNIVAAYLFTLTATFQGFVLFIFFIAGNKKTRELWLNKLKIKQTQRVPVTSSSYTNKSSGVRSGPSVSNSSKPKSLSLQDDSKFS